MTPQNTVDLKGNLSTHSSAEILVEIGETKLSGSMRLTNGERKTIVYIRDGEVVYAVSNARAFRLFSVLLASAKIDKNVLLRFPNFANDTDLAAHLLQNGSLTKEEIDAAVVSQIKQVIINVLIWPDAEWIFSPLARLREDLIYDASVRNVMIDYARCIPPEMIRERFKSVDESFTANFRIPKFQFENHESEVLDLLGHQEMTIGRLKMLSTFPESALFQALYVLWLGGFLKRKNWNTAFSPAKLEHIKNAKMSPVKTQPIQSNGEVESLKAEEDPKAAVAEITLEEYLERVEGAETHYDLMGVTKTAPASEIKAAYLMMAKLFHPDRYHRETGSLLRRIQVAFTNLAQAYETLKSSELRESYDYKVRKQLEAREKRRAEGIPEMAAGEELISESGAESFEAGLNHLMDGEHGPAATQFARAVHTSPQNAVYHSYYGQALSFLEKFQHKAEAEMQEAVRLDPKSAKIRMTLVQFFIDRKMAKRAEGELNRFLQIAPDNKEANVLLNSLQS
ncbi:MAG: DnaJ domain-containing protein [Pyrinomonadaceae bacterium]